MSDENALGTVTTQAPPEQALAEEAGGRSSKALLIAGAVAVVVLGVFAYLLFFGGGSDDSASQGTVPKPVVPGAPATDSTKDSGKSGDSTKDQSKSETKSSDVEGRDPFKPLEVEAPATETTTDTTTTPPTTEPAATVNVGLVSVSSKAVTATVDSKTYKGVAEGETFATNFQVYAIFNDSCAGFLYGDDSFVLCEGNSINVTKLS